MWKGRNAVAKGGLVHIIEDDTEEGGGLLIWIGLKLGVDLDDEGGSDGREQASL